MSTTAGDLITAAFNKVGVYNPTANQTASALISLNNLVSSWVTEYLRPAAIRESFTLTSGDAEYTIGPSGDKDTVRPMRIENAYLTDSAGHSWPIEVINAKDWNDVGYKATEAKPERVYFIPQETTAKIIFECEPNEAYTFYYEAWQPITEFTDTTTETTLPVEYKEAVVYNLAVSLAEDWDRTIHPSVYERAKETKYLLSAAGASTRPPAKAKFDMLIGTTYDITSDT